MRVHQNIIIDGVDLGDRSSRKNSMFCNEGKWNTFIEPLLASDCSELTFVEMGSNAGMFTAMATTKGFDKVIGIEMETHNCEASLKYRDSLGMDFKILNRTVGKDFVGTHKGGVAINPNDDNYQRFDFDEIPVADVTLLANFHYHLDINSFLLYLDRLKYKTRYVIVVSANVGKVHWKPYADITSLRYYFKDWEEVRTIYPPDPAGDPHPRPMFGMLFESPLRRMRIADIQTRGEMECDVEFMKNIDDVKDIRETAYYKNKAEMRSKWNQETVDAFVNDKLKLLRDIKENGLKDPILVRSDGKLIDGGHRLLMQKVLGYKSIIVRRTL